MSAHCSSWRECWVHLNGYANLTGTYSVFVILLSLRDETEGAKNDIFITLSANNPLYSTPILFSDIDLIL